MRKSTSSAGVLLGAIVAASGTVAFAGDPGAAAGIPPEGAIMYGIASLGPRGVAILPSKSLGGSPSLNRARRIASRKGAEADG
jgi:hypothetical protein